MMRVTRLREACIWHSALSSVIVAVSMNFYDLTLTLLINVSSMYVILGARIMTPQFLQPYTYETKLSVRIGPGFVSLAHVVKSVETPLVTTMILCYLRCTNFAKNECTGGFPSEL